MNDRALNSVMQDTQIKLGAGAGLAIATLGAGANGSLEVPSGADIYSLSSSAGLFGGVPSTVARSAPTRMPDAAYYGRQISAADIVLNGRVKNPAPIICARRSRICN